MDISNVFKNAGQLIKRNSSTILTGLAVAGTVSSVAFGIKAGINTGIYLRILQQEALDNDTEMPSSKQIFQEVYKEYIPAVGLGVLTVVCVVGAQSINLRKQAAVITAFSVTESALREYQERMSVEAPSKDRKVRDDMARSAIEANPASQAQIFLSGNGDQLFYEARTDRYFYSTMNKIDKAVNDINFRILNQEYASINEFYLEIGLKAISGGDDLGWTNEQPLELDKSTHITDKDESAIVIDYVRPPRADAWKFR